jgi:transcriptional regulator with XRE-family HTH domain
MQYGERIKYFRKDKELTQDELGSMVGKKQNQISEWENDIINPEPGDIYNLCKALAITPNKFYDINDEDNIVANYVKNKGLSAEEAIKAIEIYLTYKDK